MKLAVLMDPIDTLVPAKDSTLAMMEAASSLGWSVSYFTQRDLYCRDGVVYGCVSQVTIRDVNKPDWLDTIFIGELALTEFDIILVRRDPPFDMEYIYATYLLELVERQGVFVANKPGSIRSSNEKIMTLQFPQCCPETLVTRDMARLRAFWMKHRNIIIKPLNAMGGHSIFHVAEDGQNLSVILEMMTMHDTITVMAQTYIADIVSGGDKRILLIDGEPIPYALARIPSPGELRGNLAAGGHGEVRPITKRDRWICSEIAPTLRHLGLSFVGIDVIGDYLTEINVTSPTCIRQIEAETGLHIAGRYLEYLASCVV